MSVAGHQNVCGGSTSQGDEIIIAGVGRQPHMGLWIGNGARPALEQGQVSLYLLYGYVLPELWAHESDP